MNQYKPSELSHRMKPDQHLLYQVQARFCSFRIEHTTGRRDVKFTSVLASASSLSPTFGNDVKLPDFSAFIVDAPSGKSDNQNQSIVVNKVTTFFQITMVSFG